MADIVRCKNYFITDRFIYLQLRFGAKLNFWWENLPKTHFGVISDKIGHYKYIFSTYFCLKCNVFPQALQIEYLKEEDGGKSKFNILMTNINLKQVYML